MAMPKHIARAFACLVALAMAGPALAADLDASDYIDQQCRYADAGPRACDCARDAFAANVASKSPDPETTRLAAMFFAIDALSSEQRKQMIGLPPEKTSRVMELLTAPVLYQMQACLRSGAGAGMPVPDTPNTPADKPENAGFMAHCRTRFDKPGVCSCLADQGAAELSPEEFDLVADLQRGMAGTRDLDEVAKEHGVTRKQLLQVTGQSDRLAGAMMSISLLACGGL